MLPCCDMRGREAHDLGASQDKLWHGNKHLWRWRTLREQWRWRRKSWGTIRKSWGRHFWRMSLPYRIRWGFLEVEVHVWPSMCDLVTRGDGNARKRKSPTPLAWNFSLVKVFMWLNVSKCQCMVWQIMKIIKCKQSNHCVRPCDVEMCDNGHIWVSSLSPRSVWTPRFRPSSIL